MLERLQWGGDGTVIGGVVHPAGRVFGVAGDEIGLVGGSMPFRAGGPPWVLS